MAATFLWQIADNAGDPQALGGSGAAVRFTQDTDNGVSDEVSPIPAAQASIERFVRGQFSGSFASITDVRFWRSDGNALNAGIVIRCGGVGASGQAFATPTTTPNADPVVPTTVPGASNVSVDASGAVRYAPALVGGAARWLRLQVQTSVSTPAGPFTGGDPPLIWKLRYLEA